VRAVSVEDPMSVHRAVKLQFHCLSRETDRAQRLQVAPSGRSRRLHQLHDPVRHCDQRSHAIDHLPLITEQFLGIEAVDRLPHSPHGVRLWCAVTSYPSVVVGSAVTATAYV
jgi:hypothetical protein